MMTEPDPKPNIDHAALERAQRYRQRQDWALTPQQRIERFNELQSAAMAALEANPDALRAFIARNHHKRREGNAKLLEQQMRRPSGGDPVVD
jgi:hypothetical protein